jgi:c-di-GMP-related signal transduction protein
MRKLRFRTGTNKRAGTDLSNSPIKLSQDAVDDTSVDVFVARQPIFDVNQKVVGHELLYRSGAANTYTGTDSTLASLEVINNSLFGFDIAQLAGGGRAFINFDRELLLSDAPYVLAPKDVVIEILESAEVDEELLEACRKLQERGYMLAADDIALPGQMGPLVDLVDYIKVDFRAASPGDPEKLIHIYGQRHTCLAEKLETQREFEIARNLGYQLFQGYFFARPAVIKGQQIPGYKMNYLRILNAVHQPELEFAELERLIRQETSVAYKLLRYVNSALFAQRTRIDSIKRALVILGEQELRKWTAIVLLMHLASDRPDALVMCALVRAHFCEALAQFSGMGGRKSELFLMGMFSLLDAMTGCPIEDALRQIRLPADIQATLLGKQPACPMTAIYSLVRAYEQGVWELVLEAARRLRVGADEVRDIYLRAVSWCEEIFRLLPEFNGQGLGGHRGAEGRDSNESPQRGVPATLRV